MVKLVQKLGVRNVGFGGGYDLLPKSLQPALYYNMGMGRSGNEPNLINLDGTVGAYHNFLLFDDISHIRYSFVNVVGGGTVFNPPFGVAGNRAWQIAATNNFPGVSPFRYQYSTPIENYPDGLNGVTMTARPANDDVYHAASFFAPNSIVGNSEYAVTLGFVANVVTGSAPSPYDYVQAVKMMPDQTTPVEVLRAFPILHATIHTNNHRNAVVPWSRWDSATMFNRGKFTTFMSFWNDQTLTTLTRYLIRWLPSDDEHDAIIDTLQFSDSADNLLMNTNYPGYPASSLFQDCPLRIVAHEGFGFYVVVDAIVSGSRVNKYYHIDPTFSYYWELTFSPLDATATTYMTDSNRRLSYIGATPDGMALTMTVQPPVLATRVLAGPYEQPIWPEIEDPSLKAWMFDLDGHDFYVLKLGTEKKTLVFDLSTEQWSWWNTEGEETWKVTTGLHWTSSGTIPINYGSNVLAGDEQTGDVWVLDPMEGTDDGSSFTRVASAQMVTEGRKRVPVYSVYLTASSGEPSTVDNTVSLEYSDDLGHTYVTADTPQINSDDYEQEFTWRSLGLVDSPGRLFRLIDKGAFARVDTLNVNEV